MKTFLVEVKSPDGKLSKAIVQARSFDLAIDSLNDDNVLIGLGGMSAVTLMGEVTGKVHWISQTPAEAK